jgi:hypothetical protein
MSDIYIDVAASGVVLRDRESSGQNSSPSLPTNHHTDIETALSHNSMGTVPLPEPVMGAGEAQ